MRVRFILDTEMDEIDPIDNVIKIEAFWYTNDNYIIFVAKNYSIDYWYISKNIIPKEEYNEIADCLLKNGFASLEEVGTFVIEKK